jgi:hypothetical protein
VELIDSREELRDNPNPKPVGLRINLNEIPSPLLVETLLDLMDVVQTYLLDGAAQGSQERKMLGARAHAERASCPRSASTWVWYGLMWFDD